MSTRDEGIIMEIDQRSIQEAGVTQANLAAFQLLLHVDECISLIK